MRKGIFTEIRLCDLENSQFNHYSTDNIKQLANSIKLCGLQSPITVWGPNQNGKAIIVSGKRRKMALDMIFEPEHKVPCYLIAPNMSETEEYIQVEESNHQIRQVSKREREHNRFSLIAFLEEKAARGDVDARKIASMLAQYEGISSKYARIYHNVYTKGIPELQDSVIGGKLSVKNAESLCKLDKDAQANVLDEVSSCGTQTEASQEINRILVQHGVRKDDTITKEIKACVDKLEYIMNLERRVGAENAVVVLQELKSTGIFDNFTTFLFEKGL